MNITVFLADDHAVVRDGLRSLLEAQGDIKVVGEAATGEETLRRLKDLSASVVIDVAIVDIAMPEPNGIEVTRLISKAHPSMAVVILSMYSTAEHVVRALEAGARAFLVKESAGMEVVNAVRAVHAGKRYLSERISDRVVDSYLSPRGGTEAGPFACLTDRERKILRLLAQGRSAAEIAKAIRTSTKNVETTCLALMQEFAQGDLKSLSEFAAARRFASSE